MLQGSKAVIFAAHISRSIVNCKYCAHFMVHRGIRTPRNIKVFERDTRFFQEIAHEYCSTRHNSSCTIALIS